MKVPHREHGRPGRVAVGQSYWPDSGNMGYLARLWEHGHVPLRLETPKDRSRLWATELSVEGFKLHIHAK